MFVFSYTFTVRAQTYDFGMTASGNITTGPQDGSPISAKELSLSKNVAYIDLHWINGPSGKGPILGYLFESKKRGE
jgi:protein sidekick